MSRRNPFNSLQVQPPLLQTATRTLRTYRFQSSSGNNVHTITGGQLLSAMGGIATVTNTTVQSMHSSARIVKVEIWTSAQNAATVAPEFAWSNSLNNVPDEVKTRPAVPYGQLGYLLERPPKKSAAEWWFDENSVSTPFFTLSAPIGTIIDVTLEGRIANAFPSVTQSVATATLGAIYFGYLDGPSIHVFQPLGVPTTF